MLKRIYTLHKSEVKAYLKILSNISIAFESKPFLKRKDKDDDKKKKKAVEYISLKSFHCIWK